jgi:hypothetical protein
MGGCVVHLNCCAGKIDLRLNALGCRRTNPKMAPLTRNLYREDEVIASLRWCAIKGGTRGKEAIFWAQEALDSGMRTAVYESLFWVWALCAAVPNPGWLGEFRELCQKGSAATDDEIQYCLMRLMRGARDSTPLALLGAGLNPKQALHDYVGQPKTPAFSVALTPMLEIIARAITQGKATFAWALSRSAWNSPAIWAVLAESSKTPETIRLLETSDLWLPFPAARWTWPCRAAAVAIATFSGNTPNDDWIAPTEWVAYKYQWQHLTMRYRRILVPPKQALYWFTERGSIPVNKTTEDELVSNIEPALRASTYWGPMLLAAPLWSDDAREIFYDQYFLDDIPDEWASASRLISHGCGAVPVVPNPDYAMLFDAAFARWFGTLPCAIWSGLDDATGPLKAAIPLDPATGRPGDLVGCVAAAYEALEYVDPDPQILRPVRREFIIQ